MNIEKKREWKWWYERKIHLAVIAVKWIRATQTRRYHISDGIFHGLSVRSEFQRADSSKTLFVHFISKLCVNFRIRKNQSKQRCKKNCAFAKFTKFVSCPAMIDKNRLSHYKQITVHQSIWRNQQLVNIFILQERKRGAARYNWSERQWR